LTQSPPPNYRQAITWLEETFDQPLSVSASGAFSEIAFGFFLNQLPGVSRIAALFDQYCIYSVAQRAVYELTGTGTQTPGTNGLVISALDFDSNQTLGNFAAYQGYGTASECELRLDRSYERYAKPTVGTVTSGSTNSTTNTGTAIGRLWLNTAFQGIPHFGIRWAVTNNASGLAGNLRIITTLVVGLRNNI